MAARSVVASHGDACMVYPEKRVALLRRPCFPRETVTWKSRVNFEDFLIAEANHVQIQASAR